MTLKHAGSLEDASYDYAQILVLVYSPRAISIPRTIRDEASDLERSFRHLRVPEVRSQTCVDILPCGVCAQYGSAAETRLTTLPFTAPLLQRFLILLPSTLAFAYLAGNRCYLGAASRRVAL